MNRSLEPEVKEEEDTTAPVSEEAIEVTVSEIVDGTHCFLHYTKDDGLANIEAKMKAFAQVNRTDTYTCCWCCSHAAGAAHLRRSCCRLFGRTRRRPS